MRNYAVEYFAAPVLPHETPARDHRNSKIIEPLSTITEEILTEEKVAERRRIEKLRADHLVYVASVKLGHRLSIVAKGLEMCALLTLTIRWDLVGLLVQLGLNILSSMCILWRFNGLHSIHEDIVSPFERSRATKRETRARCFQAVLKLVAAISLVVFASLNLTRPVLIDHFENYISSLKFTAAVTSIGTGARVILTSWIAYNARKGLKNCKSISSVHKHTHKHTHRDMGTKASRLIHRLLMQT